MRLLTDAQSVVGVPDRLGQLEQFKASTVWLTRSHFCQPEHSMLQDWVTATNLLLTSCNKLARQELCGVGLGSSSALCDTVQLIEFSNMVSFAIKGCLKHAVSLHNTYEIQTSSNHACQVGALHDLKQDMAHWRAVLQARIVTAILEDLFISRVRQDCTMVSCSPCLAMTLPPCRQMIIRMRQQRTPLHPRLLQVLYRAFVCCVVHSCQKTFAGIQDIPSLLSVQTVELAVLLQADQGRPDNMMP